MKIRSYATVVRRLKVAAACGEPLTLARTGRSGPYDLYLARLAHGVGARCQVLLSAGIHGDEPAGVEAVLRFLERPRLYRPYLDRLAFLVFPCLNPSGYERGSRENADGLDLNRQYDHKNPPAEIRVVWQAVGRRPPDVAIDLHEDVDAPGFYLYELVHGRQRGVGRRIIAAVERTGPVDRRPVIEGLPSRDGLIRPPRILDRVRRMTGWPQAIYLFMHGARHSLTCETPTILPFEKRVAIHLAALDAALRHWQRQAR